MEVTFYYQKKSFFNRNKYVGIFYQKQ